MLLVIILHPLYFLNLNFSKPPIDTALFFVCFRYRYPLYRKRSSTVSQQSAYETEDPEYPFFNIDDEYPDSDVIYSPPQSGVSPFRERTANYPRERFMERPVPSVLLRGGHRPDVKRDFTEANDSPYYMEAQMYEQGNRNDADNNPESIDAVRNTLQSLHRRKWEDEMRKEQLRMEEAELLRELLNRATNEYGRENNPIEYEGRIGNEMVRSKRNTRDSPLESEKIEPNKSITGDHLVKIPIKVSVAEYHATLAKDRKKRAYGITTHIERRKKSYDKRANERSQEDIDDFLTREYFKSIARSVGNKKKRMAYAQFEPNKRSTSIDAFLDNPEMLQYMMDQLKSTG